MLVSITHLLVGGQHLIRAQDHDSGTAADSAGIRDRTDIVRNGIPLRLPDVAGCADVADAELASITGEIVMLDNGTITLEDGDFAGLSIMEIPYLHHNDLSSLPENVLDGLTAPEELSLYDNTLTTLPADLLDDLDELRKLELSYNELSSLPGDVFDGLSRLEELHLRDNDLGELPDGISDGLSSLQVSDLNSNRLSSLPDGILHGLCRPPNAEHGWKPLLTLHLHR